MIKFPLLQPQDIEVKVKQITKTGALFLLYKTARVDANILDEAVGPMNWTNSYEEIKGNLYCKVGIREDATQDFVYKEDCGIESGQDDGNEKKAEASDAFKRCCSKLGIGRELYTSPAIWANVLTEEKNGKWQLSDKFAKYIVTEIQYDEPTRTITKLVINNAKSGIEVFNWSLATTAAMMKKMNKITANRAAEEVSEAQHPEKAPKSADSAAVDTKTVKSSSEEKKPLKTLVNEIGKMAKNMFEKEGNRDKYVEIIKEVTGLEDFKCSKATEDQYDMILTIHDRMTAAGYSA